VDPASDPVLCTPSTPAASAGRGEAGLAGSVRPPRGLFILMRVSRSAPRFSVAVSTIWPFALGSAYPEESCLRLRSGRVSAPLA